jgi:hypothetical protein
MSSVRGDLVVVPDDEVSEPRVRGVALVVDGEEGVVLQQSVI